MGQGLAYSIHINQKYKNLLKDLLTTFIKNGLLLVSPGGSGGTTFKLVPPMIIDKDGIESGCKIIDESIQEIIDLNLS